MTSSRLSWVFRIRLLAAIVGLCVGLNAGCSKPAEPPGKHLETAPAAPDHADDGSVQICVGGFRRNPLPDVGDAGPHKLGHYPDDAVRRVLIGLREQKLGELWRFLPDSYREDIQKLVRDVSGRLDEKSWGPFVSTCQKARTVVSKIVRELDKSDQPLSDSDKELAVQLRAVEKLLTALCDSELRSVSAMQAMLVDQFLNSTGHSLLAALSEGALGDAGDGGNTFSQFGKVKVELVEAGQNSAVVSVQWPGQEPARNSFVRVQSHWIPQTLSEAWPTEFPKVREQCLAWADQLRSNPEPWHARLREIDVLLDELAKTKSLAETRQVWQAGVSHLAVEWFGAISVESPMVEEIPAESPPAAKPARVKRPDTEVLLPDEPQK